MATEQQFLGRESSFCAAQPQGEFINSIRVTRYEQNYLTYFLNKKKITLLKGLPMLWSTNASMIISFRHHLQTLTVFPLAAFNSKGTIRYPTKTKTNIYERVAHKQK